MSSKLLSFTLKLVLLTLITGFTIYLLEERISDRFFYKSYQALLLFFFVITFLLHLGYERTFAKGSKYFIRFYMMASGLKLFAFLTIIMAFAFVNKEHLVAFALNFLLMYFIYTAFEVGISFKKFGAVERPIAENSNNLS